VATRDIMAGEELACNYAVDFPDEGPAKLYEQADWL
jgi:SET domain-containing protein